MTLKPRICYISSGLSYLAMKKVNFYSLAKRFSNNHMKFLGDNNDYKADLTTVILNYVNTNIFEKKKFYEEKK